MALLLLEPVFLLFPEQVTVSVSPGDYGLSQASVTRLKMGHSG